MCQITADEDGNIMAVEDDTFKEDIDECQENPDICGPKSTCNNIDVINDPEDIVENYEKVR